jgi:hypothetical protein
LGVEAFFLKNKIQKPTKEYQLPKPKNEKIDTKNTKKNQHPITLQTQKI